MPCSLLSCQCGKCMIPQRYVMVFLVHLGLVNAAHLRVVLNITIVEMIAIRNDTSVVDACPMYTLETVDLKDGEFNWPNNIEAFTLYAFYIGYMISQIPGGWLADKIGAKWVLGTCICIGAVVTILYPLSLKLWDYYGAISLRVIVGVFQGPIAPTITSFIICWLPEEERTFLGSIIYSGFIIGTLTGSLLTSEMIRFSNSWAFPFYVWGCVALIWYAFYIIWISSEPISHPFITERELRYLYQEVRIEKHFVVPWCAVLTSAPVWALLIASFGYHLIHYSLFTNSPKYMKEILNLNIEKNALFYSVPFVLLWFLSILSGYTASLLEGLTSVGAVRRGFTLFAIVVPASLVILIPYMGCDRVKVLVIHTLAIGLMAPYYSGAKQNVEDISIHYSGTVMALINSLGACAGIAGPYLIGVFTSNASLEGWQYVFSIIGGTSMVCASIYFFMADDKRQPWDYLDETIERKTNRASTRISMPSP